MTTSLTNEEKAVLAALVVAWETFLKIPVEHADDKNDFRFHLHALQNLIAARPAFREIRDGK